MAGPVRLVVVWCPDWPIIAAGVHPEQPAAVVEADHVIACSAAARAEGVRRGLRRREAQRRCPELALLPAEHGRDLAAFDTVLGTVEQFTDRVEVIRPGTCAFRAGGPSRLAGGDGPLAAQLTQAVGHGCQVGMSDGLFAAGLAARTGRIVPPGQSRRFLAPLPVSTLDRPDLADLLVRLGIRTLGDFAALPATDVLARFGPDGARAHRLASGLDERPLALRQPPPELCVQAELDPPAERVDVATFAVKALADELHERLAGHRLVCTRVGIEVQTEHGERLLRLWRHDGMLTSAAIAERMRWQLDGWLSGTAPDAPERPTAGISLLRLRADEVAPGSGHQLDLTGSAGADVADERVIRAISRVQGMLGHQAVTIAVRGGGRGPADRVRHVPWGDPREPALPADQPWPGQVPPPEPATVYSQPPLAQVSDRNGEPVTVSGRNTVSAAPTWITVAGRRHQVAGWVGPWPCDERWWDPARRVRRARIQVSTSEGAAYLLALDSGRWLVEAEYD